MTIFGYFHIRTIVTRLFVISIGFLMVLSFAGCSSFKSEEQSAKETEIKETEIEINVKQTLIAQQPADQGAPETQTVQQATLQAQAVLSTNAAQQANAPNLDQTAQAQQATQIAIETANAAQAAAQTPDAVSGEDLDAFMKSANILLYEDMIGRTDTIRYVKNTLDMMGLPYKDVGSAQGWLKEDLTRGAPNGKPWDLVILSAEDKAGIQGEFFTYVNNLLDQGTSVILEVWYLDNTFLGTAQSLLARCGIQYQLDWQKIPPSRQVMFPLDPSNPILQEPNSGLSFTKTTSYWWDPNGQLAYDIGDLMQVVPGGDAKLLVGTTAEDKNGHGTVAVCLDGRLIMQTFSSHSLTYEAASPLWQNYIYNALKVRMTGNP